MEVKAESSHKPEKQLAEEFVDPIQQTNDMELI